MNISNIKTSTLFSCCVLLAISSCKMTNSNLSKNDDYKIFADTLKHKPFIFIVNSEQQNLSVLEFKKTNLLINNAVDQYNNKAKKKSYKIDLRYYFRQYAVKFNEKGEKIVEVNFLCRIDNKDLDHSIKNKLIAIYDGGKCYFNLKINLSTNSFYEFYVNGVA